MKEPLVIRTLTSAELDPPTVKELVLLHVESFPGFFLTALGPAFLRLLYTGFASERHGVCVVAEESGRITGVAAGTTEPARFFKRLLRRYGARLAMAAIPGLLRNPWFVARKCLGAIFYRGEQPGGLHNAALLSSLAVAPACSGKGVGQQLVHAFSEEARKQGCSAIYLTTDEAENEWVNRFYARNGFVLRDTFKRQGHRIMNRWVRAL